MRWIVLEDEGGRGLKLTGGQPLAVNALAFPYADLAMQPAGKAHSSDIRPHGDGTLLVDAALAPRDARAIRFGSSRDGQCEAERSEEEENRKAEVGTVEEAVAEQRDERGEDQFGNRVRRGGHRIGGRQAGHAGFPRRVRGSAGRIPRTEPRGPVSGPRTLMDLVWSIAVQPRG